LDGSFFSASCKYKALNLSPKWKASSFLDYAGLEGNFLLLWHRGRRFLHYKVGNCAKSENLLNDHLHMNFEFKMLQEYILMYIVTILEVWGTGCHSSLCFLFFLNIFEILPPTPKSHDRIGKKTPKTLPKHFYVCRGSSAGFKTVVTTSAGSGSRFPKNWKLFFQDPKFFSRARILA
jgi:hypothetical protein